MAVPAGPVRTQADRAWCTCWAQLWNAPQVHLHKEARAVHGNNHIPTIWASMLGRCIQGGKKKAFYTLEHDHRHASPGNMTTDSRKTTLRFPVVSGLRQGHQVLDTYLDGPARQTAADGAEPPGACKRQSTSQSHAVHSHQPTEKEGRPPFCDLVIKWEVKHGDCWRLLWPGRVSSTSGPYDCRPPATWSTNPQQDKPTHGTGKCLSPVYRRCSTNAH